MLSLELFKAIQRSEQALSDAETLLGGIRDLADSYQIVTDLTESKVSGAANPTKDDGNFRAAITKSVAEALLETSPHEMYRGFDRVRDSIYLLIDSLPTQASEVGYFSIELDRVAEKYNAYVQDRSPTNALDLARQANIFTIFLKGYSNGTATFTRNYQSTPEDQTVQGEISIILPGYMDLPEFISKLNSIRRIYEELCALNDSSLVDHPLGIKKIESGSLWTILVGKTRIVELMFEIIRDAAGFFHRKYTREGRIAGTGSDAESVLTLLSLREKLTEAGLDTSDMDENLQKAAYTISKDLKNLLADQPKTVINGETYLLTAEAQDQQLAAPRSPPRIGRTEDKDSSR